jgi:glycosyltransferase involved in cell wall biosynthesis
MGEALHSKSRRSKFAAARGLPKRPSILMSSEFGCSVVIPTHNRAKLVERAVTSGLAQTHRPLEVLVVDDGSTDDTEAIVRAFPPDLVRYIRKETNSGAAESRNRGAREARYPYLTFLDSDDEAHPDWLESMLKELAKDGVAAACCGMQNFDARGRLLRTHLPSDMGPAFDHTIARFSHGGVFVLRKALFDEVGGYDASLASGQHTELAMRLIARIRADGLRISNLFRPLIRVNVHNGARIRTNWNALFEGSLAALQKHPEAFAKDPALAANYLSIAGISRARVRRFAEARRYLGMAVAKDPRKPVRWGRWLVAHLPWIREQVWKP